MTDMLKMAEIYKKLIEDEGYKVDKDLSVIDEREDCRIVIKADGMAYVILLDHEDTDFVRIILPNFYSLKEEQSGDALVALEVVARTCKGAKVHLTPSYNDAMAVMEFLDNGNSVDAPMLSRYIKMVRNAATQFAAKMNK